VLKKRFVGVITVKDGWAVQSFGYGRYLPLGRAECLAENLDRWGVDEILILCIDRTLRGLGPDLPLLRSLGKVGLSTPLTYAGGVHTVADAGAVIQSGAERLCVDAALRGAPRAIREMSTLIGAQAVIAALPLSSSGGRLLWYDYGLKQSTPLERSQLPLLAEGVISEALVIDWRHEGHRNAFDMDLVRRFPFDHVPLIAFGGVSEGAQLVSLFGEPAVAAVGIGNFLSYSEHAVQQLKRQLTELPVRPAAYAAAAY
jgi:imidazole glycerol-phosphate synthase subunit HisF